MKKRGQISLEYVLMVGVILILFLVILGFSLERKSEVEKTQTYLDSNSECLKFSNLISEAYAGGNGTSIKTTTDYLINLQNFSTISIESVSNVTAVKNKIAFLVSNCGPSKEADFYEINNTLKPDWYQRCLFGCPGSCNWFAQKGIVYSFDNLINNLSSYDTVYLEDPHITSSVDSTKQKLQNWTSQGKALIFSEHLQYLIWPSYIGDYSFANVKIHQRGSGSGWFDLNVTQEHDPFNLVLGENLEFEERSWIENVNAEDFTVIVKYKVNGVPDAGDSKNKPAIAFWKYGKGMIFYFGDFEVNMIGKDFTSQVLSKLIQSAYYLIAPKDEEASCTFYGFSPSQYKLTGDLLIQNVNNEIIIQAQT